MLTLYFRLGDMAGFTAKMLADQKEGFAIPVRELVQNALDASDASKDTCQVDIYLEEIDRDDIPCLGEYREALEKAKCTQKGLGSYKAQQQQIVTKMEGTLKQDRINILSFADNGHGMNPESLEALLSQRSLQKDESSAGAYGVGHLSTYSLSSLRYVLYATRYADKKGGAKKTCLPARPYWPAIRMARPSGDQLAVSCRPRREMSPTPNINIRIAFPNLSATKCRT